MCIMALADVAFALKRLRSRSASVFGVIAMLIVGIGLATTMFALSDPFLSRPLPYARADRLILIDIDTMRFVAGPSRPQPDYPLLRDWQARTDLFDGLAAFTHHDTLRVRLSDRVVALEAIAVSANMFNVLGVTAPAPVTPTAFDDEVWLTSHAVTGPLASMELANRTLSLQPSGSLQVTGVLPSSFLVPQTTERMPVDALVELAPSPIAVTDGGITKRLSMVGRLRDGVEPAQVEAALNADAMPRRFGVTVTPLEPAMKAQQRPLAVGALLAGLLVLIVCAANTLGMALTRGLYRAHQMATMEVLGASRARLARLLLAEAVCVAAAGTVGAFILVPLLFDAIVAVVPRNLIVLGVPELSARVAAFAGLAGLIACGAWWIGSLVAWLRGLHASLREAVLHDGRVVRAIRFGLTAGQVAVTLVLLAGAGLLVQSFLNLVRQDTGMAGGTMALSVSYGPEVTGVRLRETIDRTTEGLRRLPGVRRAAAVVGDMADHFDVTGIVVIGQVAPVELLWVSPGYFETAGMSFVRGRPLVDSDAGGGGVVVNETFVTRYLGGHAAIGNLLRVGGRASPIVGIVKDSRRRALDEAPRPAVFRVLDGRVPGMHVTYLTSGTTTAAGMWESLIHRVSPDAVVLDGSTLRARLARTIQDRSFATLVVGLFAVATIVMTAVGIIGVVGYGVARRTREIGIRLAMGATSGSVTWLTMRDACVATGAGAAMGLIAVVWLSDVVSSLLYDVSPRDWTTLAATTFALIGLVAAAAIVPARRAGRLSPTVALREE
jgi:putative ABC transport system permease protein